MLKKKFEIVISFLTEGFGMTRTVRRKNIHFQKLNRIYAKQIKKSKLFNTDNGCRTGFFIWGKLAKKESKLRGSRSHIHQECKRIMTKKDYCGFSSGRFNKIRKFSRWTEMLW